MAGYTELEWDLRLQSPAAGSDIYEFRVYDGSTPLDTYAVTPQLTVTVVAAFAAGVPFVVSQAIQRASQW
jgi:hypothetical protein